MNDRSFSGILKASLALPWFWVGALGMFFAGQIDDTTNLDLWVSLLVKILLACALTAAAAFVTRRPVMNLELETPDGTVEFQVAPEVAVLLGRSINSHPHGQVVFTSPKKEDKPK